MIKWDYVIPLCCLFDLLLFCMKVTICNLSHWYSNQGKEPLWVFRNFSLQIKTGEFAVLLGPSGCGKSTLLRILAGLLTPCAGEVKIEDQLPQLIQERKHIAWMAQNTALLPWKDVAQNIALAQQINPQNGRITLNIDELLALVGLQEYAHAFPFMLSGGMQQRVQLAKVMANNPSVLLLDELTTGLDVSVQAGVLDLVRELQEQLHIAMVVVSHDLGVIRLLAGRTMVMKDGQVVESGLTDQVLEDPHHPYTQLLVASMT